MDCHGTGLTCSFIITHLLANERNIKVDTEENDQNIEDCASFTGAFCEAFDAANACCPACRAATDAYSNCALREQVAAFCPDASCGASTEAAGSDAVDKPEDGVDVETSRSTPFQIKAIEESSESAASVEQQASSLSKPSSSSSSKPSSSSRLKGKDYGVFAGSTQASSGVRMVAYSGISAIIGLLSLML